MKKTPYCFPVFLYFFLFCVMLTPSNAMSQAFHEHPVPFSTNEKFLTIWNGKKHTPFFVKGINLGVSTPGTFPGELAATYDDYMRWFNMISDAGFNTIRLYTLHYPRFYDALDHFNKNNPNNPLFFFQGVWLNEEPPNYEDDLYQITNEFDQEVKENIDCVHGNANISHRFGKAYGVYTTDVSRYMCGYIIGREIHPPEVGKTNALHKSDNAFFGNFLSIENVNACEAWMTNRLDNLISYEHANYQTYRPVSFSSWPTLDPLTHPEEGNQYEDSTTIDLNTLDFSKTPAGFFMSYHAYSYYPDFISKESNYQHEEDYIGQNSYLAYLKALTNYHTNFPVIIAEFGTSSSWGIAHYAQNGVHHGGANEIQQGKDCIRLFQNLVDAQTGGGMQFAWIDEWFKRTWITDEMDKIADRRVLWHNVTAAEQNFGLLGFRKKNGSQTNIWENFCDICSIISIESGADYGFLHLKINTQDYIKPLDTIWVALDTYAENLGEKMLPNGTILPHGSEFLLQITSDKAQLYVTEAYDLYGIWHYTAGPEQIFKSTATMGKPWRLVRWKNNQLDRETQFIGNLGINRLNLPLLSTDAVKLDTYSVDIKLPWTLLNITDPSQRKVMHDNRLTPAREDTVSDGLSVTLAFNNQVYSTNSRYLWETWAFPNDYEEYEKESYKVIKKELPSIVSPPIAVHDTFVVSTEQTLFIPSYLGLLSNDISMGYSQMQVALTKEPKNGFVHIKPDGSFEYFSKRSFIGTDTLTYQVIANNSWSEPVEVYIHVVGEKTAEGFAHIFPNPSSGIFNLETFSTIDNLEILDIMGRSVYQAQVIDSYLEINISDEPRGIYIVKISSRGQDLQMRMVKY